MFFATYRTSLALIESGTPLGTPRNKIRRAGYVARVVEMRNAYKVWVGKPEGNRPIGIRRLQNNIKMCL